MASNSHVFVAPVDFRDPDSYGLFTSRLIAENEIIFWNGPFDVTHADFCLYTKTKWDGTPSEKKARGKGVKARHVYEFTQSTTDLKDFSHVGSTRNGATMWCDMKKHLSPALFLNSIATGDPTYECNVKFDVVGSRQQKKKSCIRATREIMPLEELKGDYMLPKPLN